MCFFVDFPDFFYANKQKAKLSFYASLTLLLWVILTAVAALTLPVFALSYGRILSPY